MGLEIEWSRVNITSFFFFFFGKTYLIVGKLFYQSYFINNITKLMQGFNSISNYSYFYFSNFALFFYNLKILKIFYGNFKKIIFEFSKRFYEIIKCFRKYLDFFS